MSAVLCLALAVYYEARNQPLTAQVAVAQVVLERTRDPHRWSSRVCEVTHNCEFSWYCDGKSDNPYEARVWRRSYVVAKLVLQGHLVNEATLGADHYHAVYVDPWWNAHMDVVGTAGDHIFYRSK